MQAVKRNRIYTGILPGKESLMKRKIFTYETAIKALRDGAFIKRYNLAGSVYHYLVIQEEREKNYRVEYSIIDRLIKSGAAKYDGHYNAKGKEYDIYRLNRELFQEVG